MTESGTYEPFPSFDVWMPEYDMTAVDAYASRLDDAKAAATDDVLERAVQVATRYAAVDTGAIEGLYTTNRGFTRTIATQSATWEAALKQHGEHVERSINDALAGYEMVLDAVTSSVEISSSWIRQLHEVICASQETYEVMTDAGLQRQQLPKGEWKRFPNNPTNADTGRVHHYAPVVDTGAEMQRLVEELRSSSFSAAHPVLQAAYAHYAFVCVHPFADGNGRVARALAAAYLYRSPGVPLVIFADQKDVYLDALEAADGGRNGPFVDFVAQRVMDTVDLVIAPLRVSEAPSVEESLRSASADRERAEFGDDALELAATRLVARINVLLQERIAVTQLPLDWTLTLHIEPGSQGASGPPGYRLVSGAMTPVVLGRVAGPSRAAAQDIVGAWVRETADDPAILVRPALVEQSLEVNRRDVLPRESELLRLKLDGWLDAWMRGFIAHLTHKHREGLIEGGYLRSE